MARLNGGCRHSNRYCQGLTGPLHLLKGLTATVVLALMCLVSVVHAQTECSCKIIQESETIPPRLQTGLNVYKLKAKEFRIEVSPRSCEASIYLLTDRSQIGHLTRTPLIFGSGGYYMAGDTESADILSDNRPGEDLHASLDEMIQMATHDVEWAKQKYKELCTMLGYCPTPVKPYSTAWPFFDPVTREDRGYAEFKRLNESSPLSDAAGQTFYVVVYTQWLPITKSFAWRSNVPVFYVLQPHILVLDFQK